MTVLWQISGSSWLELEISKKKKDGRTITGTITKRYPKVTRRCLGPPLTHLLVFEALFYSACICLLAVATSLIHLPPTMHVPAVESLLRSHHSAGTACSHTLITIRDDQSNLSEAFCATIAGRELCLSLNIKPCMPNLRMLADRDGKCTKVSRLEFRCFRKRRAHACMTLKNRAWRNRLRTEAFLCTGACLHPKHSKPCKTIGDSLICFHM